ncbi:MAG TPA: histidinol-phosphate transaminase [Methanospirillum sp.]|nr:histidinol-phosphate transaminase [Methanospirillum sp.]
MNDSQPLILQKIPPHIQNISPYIPSQPDDILKTLFHAPFLYRMNNNENVLGPPEAAKDAITRFDPDLVSQYPSGDSYHLRHRLSQLYGLPMNSFIIGNGANEGVNSIVQAFCRPGDTIITADKTFSMYEWIAEYSEIQVHLIPLKNNGFDSAAILAARDKKTKIIYLCNPNNPTGTYWNHETLCEFLDKVHGEQIVVIDEAYAEYVTASDYPDGINLIPQYPNLVVFRTFSKMYGLAGLRIGYLASSCKVTDIIRRTSPVYSVNTLAQVAALGALADDGSHIRKTRSMITESRRYTERELKKMGLLYISGEGNFILIEAPISDTLLYRRLMHCGYMVRPMTQFRFPNFIRVTFHPIHIMEGFMSVLPKCIWK